MTYMLSPRLFIENGPTVQAAKSAALRKTSNEYLAWRSLDADRRLALVDGALAKPANDDSIDGYPVAL